MVERQSATAEEPRMVKSLSVRAVEGRLAAPEPFVGVQRVAEHLEKPRSWVYNRAVELGLPMYRVGNQLRFKLSEVDHWVRERSA